MANRLPTVRHLKITEQSHSIVIGTSTYCSSLDKVPVGILGAVDAQSLGLLSKSWFDGILHLCQVLHSFVFSSAREVTCFKTA